MNIDGTTQPGATCPRAAGDGLKISLSPTPGYTVGPDESPAGLTFTPAGVGSPSTGHSSVRGLIIGGFPGEGIAAGTLDVLSDGLSITCNIIGTGAKPNGADGIRLADVNNALIGADVTAAVVVGGDQNIISHNAGAGIAYMSSLGVHGGNQFAGNEIHDNGGLGIDLGSDGVTAERPGRRGRRRQRARQLPGRSCAPRVARAAESPAR